MTPRIYRKGRLQMTVSAYALEPTGTMQRGRPVYTLDRQLIISVTGEGYSELLSIPQGFRTDLASIPVILVPIVGMPASAGVAAIAHDFACAKQWPRWKCNAMLRGIMEMTGKPGWRCKAFWWAVFIFGYQSRVSSLFSWATKRRVQEVQDAS
jgi:hypothetical protein